MGNRCAARSANEMSLRERHTEGPSGKRGGPPFRTAIQGCRQFGNSKMPLRGPSGGGRKLQPRDACNLHFRGGRKLPPGDACNPQLRGVLRPQFSSATRTRSAGRKRRWKPRVPRGSGEHTEPPLFCQETHGPVAKCSRPYVSRQPVRRLNALQ
jgi:hypothetical protein